MSRNQVGTKAPKMRFKMGQRILYEGVDYMIDGAYRLESEPNEWRYRLVDMTPIVQRSSLYALDEAACKLAPEVERIVYEPFRSGWDAGQHFWAIPAPAGRRGDIAHVANKLLIQKGKVL